MATALVNGLGGSAGFGEGVLNRNDDGSIDREGQYDAFYAWLRNPEAYKPGNLMWKHGMTDGMWARTEMTDEERLQIAPSLELRGGASVDHIGGIAEDRVEGTELDVDGITNLSGFGELSLRPLPWLVANAGARGVYGSSFGGVGLWKAGLAVFPWPSGELNVRHTRNYRQPTIRERNLPFPVANPNLRPELSDVTEIGFSQRLSFVALKLTGFRSASQDLIRTFGVFPSAEVVNVARAEIWGLEGSAEVQAGPTRTTLNSLVMDVGRFTRQNPSQIYGLVFELELGRFRSELTGQLLRELYDRDDRRDRIGDVLLTSLALRYAFRHPSLDVALLLRNLLDVDQEVLLGYPLPGINGLISLTARM
ncbi:MAG: TonB-dependent receptor [Myxococcales bacterium]|nr:TonB-dependent receptor [Myxococcales bacterium]